MIQLTKQGLAGSANIEELEQQFTHSHVFRLPGLLHPELLKFISSRLDACNWSTQDDGTIAREAAPDNPIPANVLNFAANTPGFLELIRKIALSPEITIFDGRIYRMVSGGNHYDSWHADLGVEERNRLIGMSINLGACPYRGGVFRLRDEASGNVLCELPNTGQGDAIFFRISDSLKHMVTPLDGSEPKTAFAGWFRSGETNFYASLRPRPDLPLSAD